MDVAVASQPAVIENDSVYAGYAQSFRPGVQLGYRRAVARHIAIGVEVEHALQRFGLWHLPAMAAAARLEIWPLQALRGLFVATVVGVHAHVFVRDPRLFTIAIAPGVEAGWMFTLPRNVTFGIAFGMRNVVRLHRSPTICTERDACPTTRTGPQPRALVIAGYRF